MSTKHTPGPWVAVTGRANTTVYAGAFAVAVGCKEADAAFIVRACNNHDALLAALARIAAGDPTHAQYATLAISTARAAIAACEAQP